MGFVTTISSLMFALPPSLPSQVTQVNIFAQDGIDPRYAVSQAGAYKNPLAAIGKIENLTPVPSKDPTNIDPDTGLRRKVIQEGSAFLIGPCLLMTNYHIAFGGSAFPSPAFLSLFTAVNGKDERAVPLDWAAYRETNRIADDWTVFRLKSCVGKSLGWLSFATLSDEQLRAAPISFAAYPGDLDRRQLWTQDQCAIKNTSSIYPQTLLFDCAVRVGASGAPLMTSVNGFTRVVGLMASEDHGSPEILRSYDDSHANIAVDIRPIATRLQQWIDADIAAFERTNPNQSKRVLRALGLRP